MEPWGTPRRKVKILFEYTGIYLTNNFETMLATTRRTNHWTSLEDKRDSRDLRSFLVC